jgi:hypothetical protein
MRSSGVVKAQITFGVVFPDTDRLPESRPVT